MTSLKKYSVLLIEDDKDVIITFSRILELLFGKVLYAKDGKKALDIININELDLVITDIRMPIMNGIDFIKNLNQSNFSVPVIVTSAHYEDEMIAEVYKLGIKEYLTKPIEIKNFIETCKKALEK